MNINIYTYFSQKNVQLFRTIFSWFYWCFELLRTSLVCRFKSQPYFRRRRHAAPELSALQTMEMPLDDANTADFYLDWYFCVSTRIASQSFLTLLPCCVLAQTLSFINYYHQLCLGRKSACVCQTFKNTPFQRKVLKTWSKVQEKFWRIRHLTHFLLHNYLGRKSETQATNSEANEQCK